MMYDNLPMDNPSPELKMGIEAAIKAGKAVMKIYSKKFVAKTKKDGSPVTAADLKSNEIIKKVLSKSGYRILSEEDKDDAKRLECKYIWIVDPLDGTSDFIKHTGEFTIMIALVQKTIPILGVIYWPTQNTLFVAQKGCGAFKYDGVHGGGNWEKIHVTCEKKLENCRVVASRNHFSSNEKALFKKLNIKEFTNVGSSLKIGKISSGEAEIYITTTNKIKEWDTCASYCVITEAGGKMTDVLGNDLIYNNSSKIINHKNGIVASNKIIHDTIIKKLGQQAFGF